MTNIGEWPTDLRGHRIDQGDPVAYNLSGTVARGTVTAISVVAPPKGSPHWQRNKVTIKVRLEHEAGGKRAGHISTVTAPENVLVLAAREVDDVIEIPVGGHITVRLAGYTAELHDFTGEGHPRLQVQRFRPVVSEHDYDLLDQRDREEAEQGPRYD